MQSDCAQSNFLSYHSISFGKSAWIMKFVCMDVCVCRCRRMCVSAGRGNNPPRGLIRKYCRTFWEIRRGKKGGGKSEGKTSSSAPIYCSHGTSPTLPPSISLFVLRLPSSTLHFSQPEKLISVAEIISVFYSCPCILVSLLLTQITKHSLP